VACNYATESAHLQSSHEQTVTFEPLVTPQVSTNTAALGSINGALCGYHSSHPEAGYDFQLSLEGLSLVLRFQNRTVHSIGHQWDLGIWETELMRLVSLVSWNSDGVDFVTKRVVRILIFYTL
jgi:hypothetical protein